MSLVFRIPAVVTFRATFLPKLLKNLQFSQLQNFVLQHKSILLTGVNSLYIELILTKIEYLYTQIFWQPCRREGRQLCGVYGGDGTRLFVESGPDGRNWTAK